MSETVSPIFTRIKELCANNDTTPNALVTEVTNSNGNISTWKKGRIRSDYLVAICDKFKVSADYVLCRVDKNISKESAEILRRFEDLDGQGQTRVDALIYEQKERMGREAKPPANSEQLATS